MERKSVSALEAARKELHRTKVADLSLDALTRATELVFAGGDDVDVLSLASVLFRQISIGLDIPGVRELVSSRIAPELLPGGALAVRIVSNLAHQAKSRAVASGDALKGAVRLAAALPPTSPHILTPLFDSIIEDSLAHRANLTAITILASSVPSDAIPSDLLPRILADVDEVDAASQRCNAIVALLGLRADLPAEEVDEAMMAPLIPYLGRRESVLTMSRYLFPSLFKVHRHAYEPLLSLLDAEAEKEEAYFGPWVACASYGVSAGYISLDGGLREDRLREAVAHADPAIRIMAFELLAHSRAVFGPRVLALVRHALVINTVIPTAGGRTDMLSAVHGFLSNIKNLEEIAVRDAARAKPKAGVAERAASILAASQAFHAWWLDEYLTPSVRACRQMPPLRSIFALKLLKQYIDIYGSTIHEKVYTPARVADLIACQASEFVDTRMTARALIAQAPLPLAGFESLASPPSQALLASARESINHPRRTQADAGRAALCIVFTKLVLPTGPHNALAFVGEVIGLAERHLARAEENLARGIVEYPLHGPLSALVELVRCLDLTTSEAQEAWKPTLHALNAIVGRVWSVTSKVVSLGPDEENDTAAHEIARAYEVIGEDEEGDDALDHTNLLSGCWRATREAADLLSVIITVPLSSKPQAVWTEEEVDAAGRQFLTWLHEVRHRGTFSKIAPALGSVVEAVRRAGLGHLVSAWVDAELATVDEGKLSTLRRSAALPFSFLALVSGDASQLARAVDSLLTMASLTSPTSDVTKVHAMNTLKTVLLDAKQARLLPVYLERTLTVSLQAFGSANWAVRNVGLILFSTLTNRALSTSRSQDEGGRAALAARQTLASWHKKYPSLIPYLTSYLRDARGKDKKVLALGEHSPLFPLLIILRSLRWSADGDTLAAGLYSSVEPFLASPEWSVRSVAAQALASLLSPTKAIEKAQVTATRVSHSTEDRNLLHGRLLFLRRLMDDVLDWPSVSITDRTGLEDRLRDALGEWGDASHPAIPAAILDCMTSYVAQTSESQDGRKTSSLIKTARVAANAFLTEKREVSMDLLHAASARLLIPAGELEGLLAPSIPEDAQLLALDAIASSYSYTPMLLRAVVRLAREGSNAVRTSALEVLAAWPSSEDEGEISTLRPDLLRLAGHARSVPLKEAALCALGRACSSSSSSAGDVNALATLISDASNEEQSEPRRVAALSALSALAPSLFSYAGATRASLLRSLLTLLEDDDVDVRAAAASTLSSAVGAKPMDQASAVEGWWSWLGANVASERELWEEWLWALVLGPQEAEEAEEGVLFVDEPPNMFRDELNSAQRAAEVLATLGGLESERRRKAEVALARLGEKETVSPIDARWAAAHVCSRRASAIRTALGQ